jgi:hypothetical protein
MGSDQRNILGSDNRHTIKEISKDGRTVTDPTDMAKSFNKYFSEMAESISNALPSVTDEQHYLNPTTDSHPNTTNQQDHHRLLYAATEAEVRSVLKNLKNTTSVGHDRLKVSTLKACIDSFITPITSIVNKSLEKGVFPDVLKISRVISFYKKGDPKSMENYRSISILSVLCKIIETIVKTRLSSDSVSNQIKKKKSKKIVVVGFFYFLNFALKNTFPTSPHTCIQTNEW